jgi:hypothetical protein
MSTPSFTNPTPQFGTAEFKGGPDRCQLCGQTLGSSYYRVGPSQSCPACAEKAKFETPKDTHSAFVRGLIFGLGGALLGLIAYSGFTIVTGIEIGYLSLLVGFLVAKAILMGSKGLGGRRYQVAAVLFTYAAVSMSAIPIGIGMMVKQKNAKKAEMTQNSGGTQTPPSSDDNSASDSTAETSNKPPPLIQPKSLAGVIGYLALVGLASPFLELENPLQGAIGIIILLVGIRIAWKMTAGTSTEILGPFNRPTAPPPAAG